MLRFFTMSLGTSNDPQNVQGVKASSFPSDNFVLLDRAVYRVVSCSTSSKPPLYKGPRNEKNRRSFIERVQEVERKHKALQKLRRTARAKRSKLLKNMQNPSCTGREPKKGFLKVTWSRICAVLTSLFLRLSEAINEEGRGGGGG